MDFMTMEVNITPQKDNVPPGEQLGEKPSTDDPEISKAREEMRTTKIFEEKMDTLKRNMSNPKGLPRKRGCPVVVTDCDLETYGKLQEALGSKQQHLIRYANDGDVILIELTTSETHDGAAHFFTASCADYNRSITGNSFRPLRSTGTANYTLKNGHSPAPDNRFKAMERSCLNVVIEVGNAEEVQSLHNSALEYFRESDNILVVVTVKIYDDPDGSMLVVLYERDISTTSPIRAISFGLLPTSQLNISELIRITGIARQNVVGFEEGNTTNPCDREGKELYHLRLRRELVLTVNNTGYAIEPEYEHAGDWVMDLYNLQLVICGELETEGRLVG